MESKEQPPEGRAAAERAASAISAAIRHSRFGPGQRLVEPELARLLGLGRGPVREALRLLSAQGLVTIERNKGAVVSRASRAMVAEVFEMRELVEGLAARRAARRVAERGCPAALLAALRDEEARCAESDPLTLIDANERLHQLIASAGGGDVARRTLTHLQLPELRTRFFQIMSPRNWRLSREDHVAVLRAVIAGDHDRAEQAMRTHVRRTASLLAELPEGTFP